jgi:glycosyltransferase involved in cell wall biosynthesis
MSPLVSVVTPTWNRHEMVLDRCIPSVQAQTWPHVEHIVVSDGPDPDLRKQIPDLPNLRFIELDRHDPAARWGHWARLRGIDEAAGELIAYLDDDNAYRPEHLAEMVKVLEDPDIDFAYGRMLMHFPGQEWEIGLVVPAYGQIDTSMLVHRRELLDRNTWEPSLPTIDWDIVYRWMTSGARWRYVPQVTVDYYR